MLAVNRYKEVLLSSFYLDEDNRTVRRSQNGYYNRYERGDEVKGYKLCSYGYYGVHIPKTRTTVPMHHLILLLRGITILDTDVIDHINGDTTDNSPSNLRIVSQAVNCRNSRMKRNNTSGITGVSWNKSAKLFIVRKYLNGERKYLGSRETLNEAIELLNSYEIAIKESGYTDRHGK